MTPVDAAIIRRKLGTIVEALAGLGPLTHLIAELGRAVPDDYYGGFVKLSELGILSPAVARDLAPAAGLRNRLVHEYDAIDDNKVLAAIGRALDLFPRYVEAIEAYLARAGT